MGEEAVSRLGSPFREVFCTGKGREPVPGFWEWRVTTPRTIPSPSIQLTADCSTYVRKTTSRDLEDITRRAHNQQVNDGKGYVLMTADLSVYRSLVHEKM